MKTYGYIRVSSTDQNERRQIDAMKEHGIADRWIFIDKVSGKDLLGTLISDLVLQLLSFVAQHERESIRKRQAEGIAAARARGVRFGRKPRPLAEEWHTYAIRAAGVCMCA